MTFYTCRPEDREWEELRDEWSLMVTIRGIVNGV